MKTTYFVAPHGDDQQSGSPDAPFQTIRHALAQVREHPERGKEPVTVMLQAGTYYLDEPIVLTPDHNGSENAPVIMAALPGEEVVISGGQKLDLKWAPYRDGILQAQTPAGLEMDQFFVNGVRQHMARYPNFDPDVLPYNGYAADAFSPERAANWKDPAGGYIHAMHRHHWGGYHYLITGKEADHTITYEGGWQNNRQMGMHDRFRFVENIFEELDAPGEWFHDPKTDSLYFYPPQGLEVASATFETARLRNLITFQGSQENPVRHIQVNGLTLRHTTRTFMDTKEPLLRSDWAIYRGGAVLFTGAEDCSLTDSELDQVGGNGVFVNDYNRRVVLSGLHIHGSGASAVCFVGNPDAVRDPLFEYHERQTYEAVDKTRGPKSYTYPAACVIEDSLIHHIGLVEKQAAGVQISMSKGITVRHCSIYDVGRAGINISEGTFGGHLIEFCDVFDTVRETGDHGSFNSWGRDRFWQLQGAPKEELPHLVRLDTETTTIRNSRWRCDRGWDVDLDDGSSDYVITHNLFLNGGLKLREGFHRVVTNNIAVNNSLHPHVWYPNSQDVVKHNIWMTAYQPIQLKGWGKEINQNFFVTEADRKAYADEGRDDKSLSGDPMFVDPAKGDYRVKEGSPALQIGFENFPMDQFGVQKPELKALSREPELPVPEVPKAGSHAADTEALAWLGATIAPLKGEEFSAFGVNKEDGGILLVRVAKGSGAAEAGMQSGDVVMRLNDSPLKTTEDLLTKKDEGASLVVVRDQKEIRIELAE